MCAEARTVLRAVAADFFFTVFGTCQGASKTLHIIIGAGISQAV
jgi:hypothetical protein